MLSIPSAVLKCVGVLAGELFDLWKASQTEIRLCVELGNGSEDDFGVYLHIADFA